MGKLQGQTLPLQQQQNNNNDVVSSRTFCWMVLCRIVSFKCCFVLLLSLGLFLSAFFWIVPHGSGQTGFDAKDEIKLAATVQACFILEKPVLDIVPHIARLEYDLLQEIAVPDITVAILSVHGASVANQTNITFGFLPVPVDTSITPVALSLLKSALLDLYLQNANLTLTSSIFGRPSAFEVLKCPGGITMIPDPAQPVWNVPEVLFNFTLHSSIDEMRDKFIVLKEQLEFGLRIRQNENVFLQLTNKIGSTKDPPVIVEASISAGFETLQPQRLRQLAQIIMGSVHTTNLGLNNSVFGKVKQISLSSYLNLTVHAAPPTLPPSPTPAPAPAPDEPLCSSPYPSPAVSSYPSPAPSPKCERSVPSNAGNPCSPTLGKEPSSSPSPSADPPSPVTNHVPRSSSSRIAASPSPYVRSYPPKLSPGLKLSPPQVSSSISSSSSSVTLAFSYKELWCLWLFGLAVLHILS